MPTIRIVTIIAAPIEQCFNLARDIDFHTQSVAQTEERAVAGRTSGLIELGETVTWEAKHLGVRQRLTSRITKLEFPSYFQDVMVQGAFHSFTHDHWFREENGHTVMIDEVIFQSPLGLLGAMVDRLFLTGYLKRFLEGRCLAIKSAAEATCEPVPR